MKKLLILAIPAAAWAVPLPPASHAAAAPRGTTIPGNCVEHTSFDGDRDVPGDYRCAGLAIAFHTAGADRSPFPIWAGQWLFVDGEGQYRVGSCTFNRGVHPSILGPSAVVPQAFPEDPGGGKGAYLMWKYGDTNDDLTAAAMWAVLHFYAQDAAGSARSDDPDAPLIPTLGTVAAASGRPDIQAGAEALDAEAARYAAPWTLTVDVDAAGVVTVALSSPGGPVDGAVVSLSVGADDAVAVLTTAVDGRAETTMPFSPGMPEVRATAAAPGGTLAYRGPPSEPDHPYGAQILVTGGPPTQLRAAADVPPPTTTTTTTLPPTTTTPPPPTTTPPTTTTLPPPTTTTTGTAEPATSTSEPTTLAAEAPTTSTSTTTTVTVPSTLPRTGAGNGYTAYIGTAVLVCGVGLIGAVRRRDDPETDPFWS